MNDIVLIKKALQSARIMEEKPNVIHNFLVGLITKVHVIAGQAIEDEDLLKFTVSELQKDISTRFKSLTLQEVEIALINGVKGDYGEYYGLNIKSFNKFLNDYSFSNERVRAIEETRNRIDGSKQIEAKGTITHEEIQRTAYENALALFDIYKQTKECPDHGNVVYNYLDKLGLIKFSSMEKWEMVNEAKKERERDRKEKSVTIVNIIEQQQECGIVVVYAKRIALRRYFGSLLTAGTELKTILDKTS